MRTIEIGKVVGPVRCKRCRHRLADFYEAVLKIRCSRCKAENKFYFTCTEDSRFQIPNGVVFEFGEGDGK